MNKATAKKLPISNSKVVDVHLVSDAPGIKNITDVMMQYFITDDISAKTLSKIRTTVNLVLLNLYHNWKNDPECFTAYARDNNSYLKENSRYNKLFINRNRLLFVIDTFAEKTLVYKRSGNYDRVKKFGSQSRIIASYKLIKYFNLYPIKKSEIVKHPDTETIWLRVLDQNGNKKKIEYRDNRSTRKMRKELKPYNELLANSIIKIRGEVLSKQFVYRIFNNDFKHGGRFYGGDWQNIKSKQCKYITINNQITSELDYSSFYLTILYHMLGTDYPPDDFDPYIFPGLESKRALIKRCTLTSLNATTKTSAIRAIRRKINRTTNKIAPLCQTFLGQWCKLAFASCKS